MKPQPPAQQPPGTRPRAAFTLLELMIAAALSTVVLAVSATFILMSAQSSSAIVQQAQLNERAGHASEFIFERIRFATSITQDISGNTLTLGYDTNFLVDSDVPPDKKTYNDHDYFETFQFVNGDGNDTSTTNNCLIYKPRADLAITNVLIKTGVRKLPNKPVFTVTNGATVIVRFGLLDCFASDGYQEVDVKATFVARNRSSTTQVITILPVD